jgi:hypothetical protein
MNNLRLIYALGILLLSVGCVQSNPTAKAPGPAISVSATWAAEDADRLEVTIKNSSDKTQKIMEGFLPWGRPVGLTFLIWHGEDSAPGQLIFLDSTVGGSYSSDIVELKPGESLSGIIDIGQQFWGDRLDAYTRSDYIFWRFEYPEILTEKYGAAFQNCGGFLVRTHQSKNKKGA